MSSETQSRKRLSALHLLLRVEETSVPYNEFSLPFARDVEIAVCTYFESTIAPGKGLRLYEGGGSLRGFFRRLTAALRERDYDVIHVHSPHLGVFLITAAIAMRCNFPARAVYTVHSSYPNFKFRNRMFLIPIFSCFRRVVCCGRASLESFPAFFRRLGGTRMVAVPNGVDLKRVDRVVEGRKRGSKNYFTAVAVGRLIKVKNPFLIVRAFGEGGDQASQLVFVGDGALQKRLQAEAEKLGLSRRVEWTGLLPRERVYGYLAIADLFVSASWVEGIPLAVLEAMASRCPVVLSDIPAHREIAQGVPFIPLVAPDNVSGFAREIRSYRRMAPAEREAIGDQCRRLVEERFDLESMWEKYEKIYAQLVPSTDRLHSLQKGEIS